MEKNDRGISIMHVVKDYHNPCPYKPTIDRLHEIGYFLSKFQADKTYTQEDVMEIFRSIIEGDKDERQ